MKENAPACEVRVLGVDPGSRLTGWGLLGGTPNAPRLIDRGVIRPDRRALFPERLFRLYTEMEALVRRLEPTSAAVESPFKGKSVRSALQLAHARGVILAALAASGIGVTEYPPATVKKAVTGSGLAEKSQVSIMVGRLLGLQANERRSHDLSDALAVALCHLTTGSFLQAVRRGRSTG